MFPNEMQRAALSPRQLLDLARRGCQLTPIERTRLNGGELLELCSLGQTLSEMDLTVLSPAQLVEHVRIKESVAEKRFAVALSFPAEHRAFVLEVAENLATSVTRERVFYDEWYEGELLGAGGDLKLQAMYMDADLVVPFFSRQYDKPWCAMEWETIRGLLLTRRRDDSVVPVHMDDTKIPGWSSVNFGVRVRDRNAVEISNLILQALAFRNHQPDLLHLPDTTTKTSAGDTAGQQKMSADSDALSVWKEKLDYLLQQEAITSDANQKFSIAKGIEEARDRIAILESGR